MATLGFKIGAASGSGATAAAAIGGGLYLGKDSSSENITTEETVAEDKEQTSQTSDKTKKQKQISKKYSRKTKLGTSKWVSSSTNYSDNPVISKDNFSEKLGDRYSLFLASTSISSELEETERNKHLAWWEDKYDLLEKDKQEKSIVLDSKFQEASEAYHDSSNTALNQICKSFFEEDESKEVTFVFTYDSANNIPINESERKISDLEKNFWRYCSPLMVKPWNMVESKEASTDVAHVSFHSNIGNILAATKDGINVEFWKIKNEWFLNLWNYNKVETKFKSYVDGKGEEVKEENQVSLRKVCSKTTQINLMSDVLTKEEVAQYCAFSERLYKQS